MQHDVIKVGGSLLTVPNIAKSLEAFLNNMPVSCKVIVVGGGIPVRKLEAESPGFSPEEEHWASLRIMTENAISLRSHFTNTFITSVANKNMPGVFFLDSYKFCKEDHNLNKEPFLPQNRHVRSDSVALRFAQRFGFDSLYLLKSLDPPKNPNWADGSQKNYVDDYFSTLIKDKIDKPLIHAINLRSFINNQVF